MVELSTSLAILSSQNVADAITEKIIEKFNTGFKTMDVTLVEKLTDDLDAEGNKWVLATIKAINVDIDARYKASVDALTASSNPLLSTRLSILALRYPQLFAKATVADVFDNFEQLITNFNKVVLLSYAQKISETENEAINNVRNRMSDLRNRIRESVNGFIHIDDDDRQVVENAVRY